MPHRRTKADLFDATCGGKRKGGVCWHFTRENCKDVTHTNMDLSNAAPLSFTHMRRQTFKNQLWCSVVMGCLYFQRLYYLLNIVSSLHLWKIITKARLSGLLCTLGCLNRGLDVSLLLAGFLGHSKPELKWPTSFTVWFVPILNILNTCCPLNPQFYLISVLASLLVSGVVLKWFYF